MVTKKMDQLNRRIKILALHLEGNTNSGIAQVSGITTEGGVRAILRKSKQEPRVVEAAKLLVKSRSKDEDYS